MAPADRLRLALEHRAMCIRLMEAGVRTREPELDDAAVRRRLAAMLIRD